MSATYVIDIYDANAQQIASCMRFAELSIVLNEREIGACTLRIARSNIDAQLITRDTMIYITRYPQSGATGQLIGGNCYIVRSITVTYNDVTIQADHATSLLRRRIIDVRSTAPGSRVTGAASSVIAALVTDAFSGTLVGRMVLPYIRVPAEIGTIATPSVDMSVSFDALDDIMQRIVNACDTAGMYIGYELLTDGIGRHVLSLYRDIRGVNRGTQSGQALYISPDLGTVSADYSLTRDWSELATFVRVAGQGEALERAIASATNVTSSLEVPLGRIERFADARNESDASQLLDVARAKIAEHQTRITFDGLVQDRGIAYGVDYDYGDIVAVVAEGLTFDARISRVSISVGERGEQIEASISMDTFASTSSSVMEYT